jgi:hypothetical protein
MRPCQPFVLSELIIMFFVRSLSRPYKRSAREAIQYVGSELLQIGSLSDSDFWDFTFRWLSIPMAERLRSFESILARSPECPPYWQEKIEFLHRDTGAQKLRGPYLNLIFEPEVERI